MLEKLRKNAINIDLLAYGELRLNQMKSISHEVCKATQT